MVLIGSDDDPDGLSRRNRFRDAEQLDEAVEPRRRAGAGEDDGMFLGRTAEFGDQRPRFPPHAGHEAAAVGGFRMAVGVIGEDLVHHETFDHAQGPAGGDIVRIDQVPDPIRTFDLRRRADEIVAQIGDQAGAV